MGFRWLRVEVCVGKSEASLSTQMFAGFTLKIFFIAKTLLTALPIKLSPPFFVSSTSTNRPNGYVNALFDGVHAQWQHARRFCQHRTHQQQCRLDFTRHRQRPPGRNRPSFAAEYHPGFADQCRTNAGHCTGVSRYNSKLSRRHCKRSQHL